MTLNPRKTLHPDQDMEKRNRSFAQALAQAWRSRESMAFLLASGEFEDGCILGQALSRRLRQLWDELSAGSYRNWDLSALVERLIQAENMLAEHDPKRIWNAAREYEYLLRETDRAFHELLRGPWLTAQAMARHRRRRLACLVLAACLSLAVCAWGGLTAYRAWVAHERMFILRSLDLLVPGLPDTVRLGGLLPSELGESGPFSWAEGPRLLIAFSMASPTPVRLTFRFGNPVAHQTIIVRANGGECKSYRDIPVTPQGVPAVEDFLEMNARSGLNTLEFVFEKYNGFRNLFAPGDPRPLAAPFLELTLSRVP